MNWKILTLAVLAMQAFAAGVSIEQVDGSFKLNGIAPGPEPSSGWQSVFAVYAADGDVPAMLGSYVASSAGLLFTPRFPLAAGVHYHAVYNGPGGRMVQTFDSLATIAPTRTRITNIYPSINVLPSNELKLYIYFSSPIQRGGVWQHIRLLDESGKKVELAFLEIDQELWDPTNQRLTVLFDPGRIKRGVKPNMDTGSAIVEGRKYTLVVDKDLRDVNGAELVESFQKEFRGGPSVRTGVDLKDWKLAAPHAGTRDPLRIEFSRPLDYALLEHVIRVRGAGGFVNGAVSIDAQETRWSFTPSVPWRAGGMTLVIDMALEDLAGNRIGRPFDVDTINHPADRITATSTNLAFEIR